MDVIAKKIGVEPLTSRRHYNDVAFIFKLISGLLICSECVQKVNIWVPTFKSRNNPPFLIHQYFSNLIANSPEYRLSKHCYDIPNFDFCFDTLANLKSIVMNSS